MTTPRHRMNAQEQEAFFLMRQIGPERTKELIAETFRDKQNIGLDDDVWNLELPKSEAEGYDFHYLPVRESVIGIMSDVHVPYHDVEALRACLIAFKKANVDTIVINGDFIDFYNISRFQSRVGKPSVKFELDTAKAILIQIRKLFPSASILLKEGNHDERFSNYLNSNAPSIADIPSVQLEVLLGLHELGITHLADKKVIKSGDLHIVHGHEIYGGGKDVAKSKLNATKMNIAFGHHHRTQEYTQMKLNKETIGAWAIGCLCELSPAYMPINEHNHGAAIQYMNSDGTFSVRNFRIIKGKVL